jgi:hypothetical protein
MARPEESRARRIRILKLREYITREFVPAALIAGNDTSCNAAFAWPL